jgi:hypothetical protein
MSEYKVLGEGEWKKRRTVADAIEVLHKDVGFEGDDRAQIRLGPMRLPSGDIVSLTGIFFESAVHQKTFIVWLPTAVKFRAILQGQSVIDQFDIDRLQEATLDDAGNVELRDGTSMRAVEIIPARLPYKLSGLDCIIISLTISKIGAQDKCSYSTEGLFSEHPDDDPYIGFIDCSKLAGLRVPELKVIKGYIEDRKSELATLSEQTISNALRKFGMRIPVARPRRAQSIQRRHISDDDCHNPNWIDVGANRLKS